MPRNTQRKTRRVAVNQTGETARLQVNTPISAVTKKRGKAFDLAAGLQIATAGVDVHQDAQSKKGLVDFETGNVDADNSTKLTVNQ